MMKEASKIVQLIIDFCRDNLDILMIGGVVVIVLILLVSSIKCFKEKDDEDLELDETELMQVVEQVKQMQNGFCPTEEMECVEVVLPPLTARVMAEVLEESKTAEKKQQEDIKNPEDRVVAISLPPLTATVMESEEASKEETQTIEETPKVEEFLTMEETPKAEELRSVDKVVKDDKKASTIESLVEEIANISGTGVKEVKIKVAGAQVKITYLQDDQTSENETKEEIYQKEDSYSEPTELLETPEQKSYKEVDQNPLPNEKGNFKFGPDNINIARSGRVYSEEELQQQIRD